MSAPTPYRPDGAATRPPPVRTAVLLMRVGAAISLISLVVSVATVGSLKGEIRTSLDKNSTQISDSTLNAALGAAIAVAVVSALVSIGLWLWMAWKNGQGRSWARIVATVLGALNVLSTIYTLTSGRSTAVSGVVAVVNLVLAVIILVLLWRKESSAFYAAASAPPVHAT